MLDLFGSKAKAKLAASEARVAAIEEALAYEKVRNEQLHRQIIAMVDSKALRAAEVKEPDKNRLPTDLLPNPPTRIYQLGKRSQKFPGLLRAAIQARKEAS